MFTKLQKLSLERYRSWNSLYPIGHFSPGGRIRDVTTSVPNLTNVTNVTNITYVTVEKSLEKTPRKSRRKNYYWAGVIENDFRSLGRPKTNTYSPSRRAAPSRTDAPWRHRTSPGLPCRWPGRVRGACPARPGRSPPFRPRPSTYVFLTVFLTFG